MYLVRRLKKTGQTQVYKVDEQELGSHSRIRQRRPKAWNFNRGTAAVHYTVVEALQQLDSTHYETLDT